MKKFLLASVLVLMFGALCFTAVPKKDVSYCTVAAAEVVATEEETPLNEETEEANYFREKIMPYITANISSILTALLTIMVSLGKIKAGTAGSKAAAGRPMEWVGVTPQTNSSGCRSIGPGWRCRRGYPQWPPPVPKDRTVPPHPCLQWRPHPHPDSLLQTWPLPQCWKTPEALFPGGRDRNRGTG